MTPLNFIHITFLTYILTAAMVFVITNIFHASLFSAVQFVIATQLAVIIIGIAITCNIIQPQN